MLHPEIAKDQELVVVQCGVCLAPILTDPCWVGSEVITQIAHRAGCKYLSLVRPNSEGGA